MPILGRGGRSRAVVGADGEVQPYGTVAILFYQQLVELLLRFSGVGQQDGSVSVMPNATSSELTDEERKALFLRLAGNWSETVEGEGFYQMMKNRDKERPANRILFIPQSCAMPPDSRSASSAFPHLCASGD